MAPGNPTSQRLSHDPLSDALGLVRARGLLTRIPDRARPWTTRFDTEHGFRLHVVMRGSCWLIRKDRKPLRLNEGDLAVTNGAAPFILASDPNANPSAPPPSDNGMTGVSTHPQPNGPIDIAQHPRANAVPTPPPDADIVVGIAGHIEMDGGYADAILEALPPVTRIEATDPVANAVRYLLDRVLREISHPRPGSDFATEKYSQLILVEVLRVALDAANAPRTGWLRLLADAELRPALALMHEQPAHPWRLTDLARAVSMSRSTFATRFRTISGEPPLTYLHHWRIQLAQAALRDTDATVATLAARLGYASESSFSHAFTRTAGVSPTQYRTLSRRQTLRSHHLTSICQATTQC